MIEVETGNDVLADLLETSGNLDAAMTVRGFKPVVYLWWLTQNVHSGYDTYDSCVVAAIDEESAKRVRPGLADGVVFDEARQIWIHEAQRLSPTDEGYAVDDDGGEQPDDEIYGGEWARHPEQVEAVCIGVTTTEQPGTVVCASYNAG